MPRHVKILPSPSNQIIHQRLLPHSQGKPQTVMKKRKKKHACQTSINTHPDRAPEGKTAIRVEIIKRKRQTLYTAAAQGQTTAILADRSRGPKGIHSRVSRIYTHQPGWDLWLF
ncbi:hypothetical protein NXS19_002003 [Fusarium pseudograminearum]|nr:hypothetical protein NXS19_002003 [Fusarium pseudograminearum]